MPKKLFLIFVFLILLGAGCAREPKPENRFDAESSVDSGMTSSTASDSTTASSTSNNPIAPVYNIISNPAEWPRFEFKELGLSMQLPFDKSAISAVYHDCTKLEDRCDNENMYWFGGSLGYIYLNSVSKNYAYGGESGLEIYDLLKKGNSYFILSGGETNFELPIHPLKVFFISQTPVIYFDAHQDFYRIKEDSYGGKIPGHYYGAVFKLPYSDKFKAALLQFNEINLTEEQFIAVLKTIKFSPDLD